MRNIKLKITKFNDYIIKLFNLALNLFKYKNNKFYQISNFNKLLIFLISILFIYLFYLSIPTLYNKDILQKQLSEKIANEHNLNVSLSSEIDYLILPSPHILIKNTKIFNQDKKNPKEISQIKKLKIFISQKNLIKQKKLRITKIVIQDANFLVQDKNISFYNDFINKKFSEKKLFIKNSNFFYKDKSKNTISMLSFPSLKLFYNDVKFINQIAGNVKTFQIPMNFKWQRDFLENPKSVFLLDIDQLNFNIENHFFIKNDEKKGKNILTIGNSRFLTDYSFKDNAVILDSKNSKIVNNLIKYEGKINIKPFYINLNVDLEKINLNKFFIKNDILKEILFSKLLFNKNLSAKVNIKSNNVLKDKLFNLTNLNFNLNGGLIDLNESNLENKKIGKLILENSSLIYENEELVFTGYFNFQIKNQKEFYRTFVVPKRNRKRLKNIVFDIEYNLFKNHLEIVDLVINDKTTRNIENIEEILGDYNNKDSVRIKNWIDLKVFVNKIFDNYFG